MAGTKKTIAEALAAFQADLPKIDLDGVNPHFKSKYATLGNVTKNVLPKLSEHGFAFTVGSFVDNGVLVLDAHLLHESGESRSMQFPITENNPQKVGSAVSYYRRYALAALTGVVADEDDDGNAASNPTATERKLDQARSVKAPTVPRGNTTADQDKIRVNYIESGKLTPDEVNTRFKVIEAANAGKNRAEIFSLLLKELEAE